MLILHSLRRELLVELFEVCSANKQFAQLRTGLRRGVSKWMGRFDSLLGLSVRFKSCGVWTPSRDFVLHHLKQNEDQSAHAESTESSAG